MDVHLDGYIKQIRSFPLFNTLDENEIEGILKQDDIVRIVRYAPGEKMITEHRLDRKMFFMMKGKISVSKEVITGNTREEQIIKIIDTPDFIGEITGITGKPRTASVTALEETVCLAIDIELLASASTNLVDRIKKKFYPKMFESLCNRLADTDDTFVHLKQKIDSMDDKIKQLIKEKIELKKTFQEEMAAKIRRIRLLEEEIEHLKKDLAK